MPSIKKMRDFEVLSSIRAELDSVAEGRGMCVYELPKF